MNKTLRQGIDVETALRTQVKLSSAERPVATAPEPTYHLGKTPTRRWSGWFRDLKMRVRTSLIDRKVKLRRSLTKELRTELLYEIHRTSAAQMAELRAQRETLERELAAMRGAVRASLGRLPDATQAQHEHADAERMWRGIADDVAGIRQRCDLIEVYSAAAARRVAVAIGSSDVLVRTEVGYVLCGADDYALLASLLEVGELERGTRLVLQRCLRPGDVFIDVGANVGMHTLAAAHAMRGEGRIIAFEPFAPTADRLSRTVAFNGFKDLVDVRPMAVSDRAGRHSLFLGITSGHHSLYPLEPDGAGGQATVEVVLERIDTVIPPGSRVDLIKIDAEGAELPALASCTGLIETNPDIALVVEFGPAHLHRTGTTAGEWLSAFERLGLERRAIHPETGALESRSIEQLESVESVNLFFTRSGSRAWERVGP